MWPPPVFTVNGGRPRDPDTIRQRFHRRVSVFSAVSQCWVPKSVPTRLRYRRSEGCRKQAPLRPDATRWSSISARDYGEAVADDDDARAELLRKFDEAIAGADLGDLRQLTDSLAGLAGVMPKLLARPELRRAPRADVAIFRVRVDLDDASPPIWRRLDRTGDLQSRRPPGIDFSANAFRLAPAGWDNLPCASRLHQQGVSR